MILRSEIFSIRIETEDGRQAALVEGMIYVRDKKGRVLASVPRKGRETEAVQTLLALKDWLAEHEIERPARVESWMLNSFPAPAPVAVSVWSDPSWRKFLKDLVICAMILLKLAPLHPTMNDCQYDRINHENIKPSSGKLGRSDGGQIKGGHT